MPLFNKFRVRFGENLFLYVFLLIVLLLATISYLAGEWNALEVHRRELQLASDIRASHDSPEEVANRLQVELQSLDQREFWAGLLHHLSLALLISFITIVSVEFHTHKLMRKDLAEHLEEVKRNVWEALGKRLLGSLIATEFEAIMKEDAAKDECYYIFTFKSVPKNCKINIPEDRVVVRIENSFKVRNLTATSGRTHRVRASISTYEKFGDEFPRFTTFRINGEDRKIKEISDQKQPRYVEEVVPLPEAAQERIPVVIGIEAVYKLRDVETFITEIPMEGIHVTVVNQVAERITMPSLDLIHRVGGAEHPTENTWLCTKAFFPGQGFSLAWQEYKGNLADTNHKKPPTDNPTLQEQSQGQPANKPSA